ncbi:hypothetical protein [Mesomycoplasma neurolyticum]|uniref:Lipoprotein n=1 Tax=Mesomycoplasma neurolyticum TaxID=2120 RepID=A0A449A5V6_9BACT|nr:hypothetical protein [Mesomycoplasma neurolyticum]VEU59609.1 Uncharacterised protein [Mesomycoplasma neurolyticum]
MLKIKKIFKCCVAIVSFSTLVGLSSCFKTKDIIEINKEEKKEESKGRIIINQSKDIMSKMYSYFNIKRYVIRKEVKKDKSISNYIEPENFDYLRQNKHIDLKSKEEYDKYFSNIKYPNIDNFFETHNMFAFFSHNQSFVFKASDQFYPIVNEKDKKIEIKIFEPASELEIVLPDIRGPDTIYLFPYEKKYEINKISEFSKHDEIVNILEEIQKKYKEYSYKEEELYISN